MAKRKRDKKQKQRKIVIPKLENVFDCPFCNHSQCIEIKL